MRWIFVLCLVAPCMVSVSPALAQRSVPTVSSAPGGQAIFRSQCGICHTLSDQEPPRQGPPLAGVFGRRAGSVPGFKYSAGFADADFDWDDERLDTWLTKPQAVIPGSVMVYRQANPATRRAIIDWLKEQH